MQVRVTTDDDSNDPWLTLSQWNEANRQLPGSTLLDDEVEEYTVHYRMPVGVGNEAMNKALTNITFVFTGTQVNN